MKKLLAVLILGLISVISAGCSSSSVQSDKPQIYTSFYAVYDFAKEIAGDKADIYNMVPSGTEPHDWEPTVQDMAKLNDADIVFYNGLGMESWVDKVKQSLSNTKFVQVSDGILTNENASDPHVWLDPKNVEVICQNIFNTLCEIDPGNKSLYNENLKNYLSELDNLDKSFRDTINTIPENNRNIIVSHEAYSYLCSAYGLNQVPIDGISADSEPSPDKMMELINYIIDNKIKYVFYEELVSPKTAHTLADETGTKLLPLNPFEGLTEEEIAKGENYISVMHENLKNIKTALS